MQTFEDITAARTGIADFYRDHSAALAPHISDRASVLMVSPSPVDQIVGLGEFIYANRDQMDNEAKGLAASLIAYATTNMWHGLGDDARGEKIVRVLRYEMGELAQAPSEANTPEPRPGQRIDPPGEEPAPVGP
jgi:hypothetical protein